MSNISPYRQKSNIQLNSKKKVTTGLLCAPKPIPPHECSLPGFWRHLIKWICGNPITKNSTYRCPDCLKIWMYNDITRTWNISYPEDTLRQYWQDNGGSLE